MPGLLAAKISCTEAFCGPGERVLIPGLSILTKCTTTTC